MPKKKKNHVLGISINSPLPIYLEINEFQSIVLVCFCFKMNAVRTHNG